MPISHSVRDDGVVMTKVTGCITEEDLMEHLQHHMECSALKAGGDEIVDLREVDQVDLPTAGLHRVIEYERTHLEPFRMARMAIVAPGDLPYGLSRMYQMLIEDAGTQVTVHRKFQEAENTLADR